MNRKDQAVTTDDLLADLRERIDAGVRTLENDRNSHPSDHTYELARLSGKIEGLKVVKDWLRSYPKVTDE
jgi:hypothetical protein